MQLIDSIQVKCYFLEINQWLHNRWGKGGICPPWNFKIQVILPNFAPPEIEIRAFLSFPGVPLERVQRVQLHPSIFRNGILHPSILSMFE